MSAPLDISTASATAFLDEPPERPHRLTGLAVVVLVHLLVGYALITGLAQHAIEVIKKPLQATIVQEVKIPEPPPPPPPPPKRIVKTVEAVVPPPFVPPPDVAMPTRDASPISATTSAAPAEPAPIAPPTPAPAPAPVPAAPQKVDIGVACPNQVKPEVPQKAVIDGLSGVVRAQVRISRGRVVEVNILSGPKVFHDAVRQAMTQYRCVVQGDADVTAVQEIKFEVE